MTLTDNEKPVIAVCGKGGVGKTALSALLARVFIARKSTPILLVDADPAGGLCHAIGETADKTLAGVRRMLVESARSAGGAERENIAMELDYLLLEALVERSGYSLLSMGRDTGPGCYCPANTLLRSAITAAAGQFRAVLIDAEAGLEQINRRVTRQVNTTVVVTDGSARSIETMKAIREMAGPGEIFAVANRTGPGAAMDIPDGVIMLGAVPEDEELRRFDREGRSLWELPDDNPAVESVRSILDRLSLNTGEIFT